MQTIDFLPQKYRDLYAVRRRHLWRLSVLMMFAVIVGGAAAIQHWMKRDARSQLARVAGPHMKAIAINQQLVKINGRLSTARHTAELVTYLRHPWPRTQLLAEIVRPLTDDITLTNIQLTAEAEANQRQPNRRARRRLLDEEGEAKGQPAERDLKELRDEFDNAGTTVYVSGVATNMASLHSYLGLLGVSSLFRKTELASLESMEGDFNQEASRFRIRIVVRPGYGQPQGPTPQKKQLVATQ